MGGVSPEDVELIEDGGRRAPTSRDASKDGEDRGQRTGDGGKANHTGRMPVPQVRNPAKPDVLFNRAGRKGKKGKVKREKLRLATEIICRPS